MSDPELNPSPTPDPKPKFKPLDEAMEKLNPKVFPELAHYRYKYTKSSPKQRTDLYILAYFTVIDDDNTRVDWSLYHEDDDESQDEEPLVELTSTSEQFHKMLDSQGWEKESGELVIAK